MYDNPEILIIQYFRK